MNKITSRMYKVDNLKINRLYAMTGTLAIVAGALLVAFTAKLPTTLAMWAGAYLVLVVGVGQILFAVVVAQLADKPLSRLTIWFYSLFNVGSLVVIASSVLKYSGYQQHVSVTALGALLVIAAMCLMLPILQSAKPSWLRVAAYVMVALLASTSVIGIVLAGID